MSELKVVAIEQIAQNPVALRNVDRQSEDFINLRDSIAKQGILNAISVRPAKEGSDKPYELIDGLHRFMAALEANLKQIPCQVITMSDAQALEAQLIANVHTVKTKPVEFARQIQRILAGKPTLTISQLSTDLAMSPSWIGERLGLLKLDKKIADLVDGSKITLTNAYALAKLPVEDQKNFVAAATAEQPSEFVPRIQQRVKEIREAARTGKSATPAAFEAQPRLRKRSEMVAELEKPQILAALIKQSGIKDPVVSALVALKWALHMDDVSVNTAKAKFEQHQKEMEAGKAKRKAEVEAKKIAAGKIMAEQVNA
jgi:ParB/RepB/Spo0J family partition protein